MRVQTSEVLPEPALVPRTRLLVRHVYEHHEAKFEGLINDAVQAIVAEGGTVGDIKYAIDPSTGENQRGGFGALIIYELPER